MGDENVRERRDRVDQLDSCEPPIRSSQQDHPDHADGKPQRRKASEPEHIDATDESILTALEHDGRATLSHLSEISGLSVSAVQSRVQKLERRGIIQRYRAVIDDERRGLPIRAFVSVTPLDYALESEIPTRLQALDGVMSCYSIAGAPSFMLVVRAPSPSALEELLNRIHRTVPVNTETTLILQTYFER